MCDAGKLLSLSEPASHLYDEGKNGLTTQAGWDDSWFCAWYRVGEGIVEATCPITDLLFFGKHPSSTLSPYWANWAFPLSNPIPTPATRPRPISTSQYRPQVLAQAWARDLSWTGPCNCALKFLE